MISMKRIVRLGAKVHIFVFLVISSLLLVTWVADFNLVFATVVGTQLKWLLIVTVVAFSGLVADYIVRHLSSDSDVQPATK